jgi:hypothetical protein
LRVCGVQLVDLHMHTKNIVGIVGIVGKVF